MYPSSRFLRLAFLFLVIIIEGLANAVIFAKGNDLGLLGGSLEALLFSAVNVVTAFGAGYVVLRSLNSSDTFTKTAAVAGCAVALTLILTVNFGVAHYRDYLVESAKSQEVQAAQAKAKAEREAEDLRKALERKELTSNSGGEPPGAGQSDVRCQEGRRSIPTPKQQATV